MTESIRKFIKDLILIITILTTGFGGLIGMGSEPVTPPDSNYPIGEAKPVEEGNFYWPEEKIFPSFAESTEELNVMMFSEKLQSLPTVQWQVLCFMTILSTTTI